MAYFELRKFNFFELSQNVDGGKLSSLLVNVRITTTSCGNGLIVLGDSDGNVHLVHKNFFIQSFSAYACGIYLMVMGKLSPILVTIGEDEMGVNSVIKVWAVDKFDKQGNPLCLRVTRPSITHKAVLPSVVAINESLTLMAVGFVDGSIVLFRGDITRDRGSKQKIFKDGLSSITGLAFHTSVLEKSVKTTHLYVSTLSTVEMYDVTHKDREQRTHLDNIGCSLGCSVLTESLDKSDGQFVVGTNDVIYFYVNGVKGSCQIISGEKLALAWYRNYLIIVSKPVQQVVTTASSRIGGFTSGLDTTLISVLDLKNNIMAYTGSVERAIVLVEWGSIYTVSDDNSLSGISEVDLHTKLILLFKKNLYDIAIRMAKEQQYDTEGLMELFRQYGDYLYNKGDHKTAMDRYIKTIGYLEPSYIIRKYRDCEKVEMLPVYLEALHQANLATQDHTTLLLNCYTKLNKPHLLKKFITSKEGQLKFDVKVAIEVCRYVSIDDALLLAESHGYHSLYLTIQLEDQSNYDAALQYIATLDYEQAEAMTKQYCTVLLNNIPDKVTAFLKHLCTGYRPLSPSMAGRTQEYQDDGTGQKILKRAKPSQFIHHFINHSEHLVDFLTHIQTEYAVSGCDQLTGDVYNCLLEHELHLWQQNPNLDGQKRIMSLLQSRDSNCNPLQALILCKATNFTPGILYLYEQKKMYLSLLKYHIMKKDYKDILATCRRLGKQEPRLWLVALTAFSSNPSLPSSLLDEILTVIDEERLMSPLLVVETLCTSSHTIGEARRYLERIFSRERDILLSELETTDKLTSTIESINQTITDIKLRPMTFQSNKCATCNKQLYLPTVNFLCLHSYHQDCFQSYSEGDECIICAPNNHTIVEALNAQEETHGLAEDFHSKLDWSDDCFSVVTDYLARGVFSGQASYALQSANQAIRAAGIGLEIRSERGISIVPQAQSSTVKLEDRTVLSKVKDYSGAIAVEERPKKLTSRPQEVTSLKSDSLFSAVATSGSGNPFGDDEDDEPLSDTGVNNPFSNSSLGSTNPFGEEDEDDDDYDKNLNPFS